MSELLRRTAAMERLGCSKRVFGRLIAAGRLVPRRWHQGGRALFLRRELDGILEELRNGDCGMRNGAEKPSNEQNGGSSGVAGSGESAIRDPQSAMEWENNHE